MKEQIVFNKKEWVRPALKTLKFRETLGGTKTNTTESYGGS